MTNKPINYVRRKVLATLTKLLGGIGICFVAYPFIKSMKPSAKANSFVADVEVEFGDLGPGQLEVVTWRRMPVYILRRTPEMLERISELEERLKDPHSEEISQQPEYAQNPYRSIRAEYLIVMGVCTHLGCAPSFKPEHGFKQAGEWWRGGFYCACHQSIYDLSGSVFKDSLAPMNLPVPPHHFLTKTRIRIGDQSLAKT